ncbi:70 kDa peptidyl-prolyl isomerase isoform X2 [Sesamum indicum]|uniref:peptidylprolyl isomerase n=1 Tax=Sesamum indicum TaxID=4182 RepID=A0A8M8UVL4_SESIN|nr:70 kDa peptidyl-prolyl isomerase isoform X2 [Sesamum indicum]
MVEFSKVNLKDIEEDDEGEEEGEEVESAPPLKVGEEREIGSNGLKKKLMKRGLNWETPQFGDEVTVHYVGSLSDGSIFISTRASNEPFTLKLGRGDIVIGLDHGIVTMRRGEVALFTLPPELAYGASGRAGIPPNAVVQLEVELLSWITVVDVCKDGGIIKKILENGEQIGPPGDLDEVRVNYKAMLVDGTIVADTRDEGVEFYIKDGHFCPALVKAIKTMKKGERVNLVVQPQYGFGEVGKKSNELPSIPPKSTLSISAELLSFKRVIDITGDLKVKKKVLREGEGTVTANEGAAVTDRNYLWITKCRCNSGSVSLLVRYKAMLEDGTVFERKGIDGEQPLEFITDEEQTIVGLDRAVSTMKKNEYALVTISPEYGFGSTEVKQDLAVVPPSSTILYEVEMLDFVREKAPWEMSNAERIEAAAWKKEEGNQLFKNGKYQRAAKKYDKAADYVGEDGYLTGDDEKVVKSLRVSCWLNGAACSLKLNNFGEAINLCSKILDVESCNVKALYRRAQAYMGISELHSAEMDIKRASEADPHNREIKLIQKSLKQLQAESNRRDAKLYKAMFPSTSKDASTAAKRLKTGEDDTRDEYVSAMEAGNASVDQAASDTTAKT